jgi:hypothetical protein
MYTQKLPARYISENPLSRTRGRPIDASLPPPQPDRVNYQGKISGRWVIKGRKMQGVGEATNLPWLCGYIPAPPPPARSRDCRHDPVGAARSAVAGDNNSVSGGGWCRTAVGVLVWFQLFWARPSAFALGRPDGSGSSRSVSFGVRASPFDSFSVGPYG